MHSLDNVFLTRRREIDYFVLSLLMGLDLNQSRRDITRSQNTIKLLETAEMKISALEVESNLNKIRNYAHKIFKRELTDLFISYLASENLLEQLHEKIRKIINNEIEEFPIIITEPKTGEPISITKKFDILKIEFLGEELEIDLNQEVFDLISSIGSISDTLSKFPKDEIDKFIMDYCHLLI